MTLSEKKEEPTKAVESAAKNKWHQVRAQRALQQWKMKLPNRVSWRTLLAILFTSGGHLLGCYVSSRISWLGVIVLAYTWGALCAMYLFSNCHEICHNSIHPFFNKIWAKNTLFRIASLPDISSGNYFYYKWGHVYHHRFLGEHSIEEIKDGIYTQPLDLDPITHLFNIYQFRQTKDGAPQYRFEAIRNSKWTRIFLLFTMPLIDSLKLFIILPMRIIAYFSLRKKGDSLDRIRDVISQDFLLLATYVTMYFLFGNINFLFYLYFSHLFFRGFMHPYLMLWMGIHKSGQHDSDGYQLTSSIYASCASFFSGSLNFHIEHHDFPAVPRQQLRTIHETAAPLYKDCFAFRGYGDLVRYLTADSFNHNYHIITTPE
jgi:fatty acid desaturase